jgi:predicted nucleic acid-binding protein
VILVDTSVWIDHLRSGEADLVRLLETGAVLGHPWVTGELALGNLRRREEILALLRGLPRATVATDAEVLLLIDQAALFASGIGYVDAQLLAATRLTPDAALWSRDRRLAAAAERLDIGFGSAEEPTP